MNTKYKMLKRTMKWRNTHIYIYKSNWLEELYNVEMQMTTKYEILKRTMKCRNTDKYIFINKNENNNILKKK